MARSKHLSLALVLVGVAVVGACKSSSDPGVDPVTGGTGGGTGTGGTTGSGGATGSGGTNVPADAGSGGNGGSGGTAGAAGGKAGSGGAAGGAGSGGAAGGAGSGGAAGGAGGAPIGGTSTTPANFMVAVTGDNATGASFQSVLDLIKREGAQLALIEGDFAYGGAAPWVAQVKASLGSSTLVLGANGNHDSWTGYWPLFKEQMDAKGLTPVVDPADARNYAVQYQGLDMVFLGEEMLDPKAADTAYTPFVKAQLARSNSIWRVCNWHRNGGRNATTNPAGRAMLSTGEKPQEQSTLVYDACRENGAIIMTAHEHVYARTRTITKFDDLDPAAGKKGIIVDTTLPPDLIRVNKGSTFVAVSGLGGHSKRDYNCAHHDADSWWATIYTMNAYARGGTFVKKDCTVTGASTYGARYETNIYPVGDVKAYSYGALFIVFNVDGDPGKARATFKTVDGLVIDEFMIEAK